MTNRASNHYYIYIEYTDHRKYVGNMSGYCELWQVEESARSYFLRDQQLYGAKVNKWVIENDDHQIIDGGTY